MKNGSIADSAARSRRILRTSIVGIAVRDRPALRAAIISDLEGRFPNRSIAVNFDTDYSD